MVIQSMEHGVPVIMTNSCDQDSQAVFVSQPIMLTISEKSGISIHSFDLAEEVRARVFDQWMIVKRVVWEMFIRFTDTTK